MKNLKKIIVAASLCAAIGATAIAGTLAYFTDTDLKTNTLTVGDVDITLTEPTWTDNGGSETARDIVAGRVIYKDPTITLEEGSVNSYVGMTISMPEAFYEKSSLSGAGDAIFTININEGWTLVKITEGDIVTLAYVFDEIRAAGENTTALFNTISVANTATAADFALLGDTFNIDAKAYATQAETFTDAKAALKAAFPTEFGE